MTSRIDKLVCEVAGFDRIADASRLRSQPIELLVDDRTPVALVRSAVALGLRCFADMVHVGSEGRLPAVVADAALLEAHEYGAGDRVSLARRPGALGLGLGCQRGAQPFVDARTWTAGINELLTGGRPSAAAASFAASAGVAKLFAIAMGKRATLIEESWHFSLLVLDAAHRYQEPGPINFGRVLLIGAGAIGSGFVHTLRESGWEGHLEIVDGERYDEPNHETTLVISQLHARARAKKAETLALLAQRPGLTAHGSQVEIDASSPVLAEPWNAVVVAVDNAELRCALDHVTAPILNAGVGGTRDDAGHVLFSRHGANDPPLSSLYRLKTSATQFADDAPCDIVDRCSRIEYANSALAAPFLGLGAGALLAGGLAQMTAAMDANANYLKLDLLECQSRFLREKRSCT